MALQNDKQSKTMLHSQAHVWYHTLNFINSMSLKCAIQLDIPDIIHHHGSPMLLSELMKALAIKKERTQCIYRLMRVLVHSGFFVKQSVSGHDEEEKEGYLLTPSSRLLLKEDPLSIRPFLVSMLDPMMMDPWQHMSRWFQSDDDTPIHTTHGMSLWDLMVQEPRLNQLLTDAMANDSRLVMSIVLEQRTGVFQGLDSIVDVGGRTGHSTKAIADAFPDISCICFDLPYVVNGLVGSKNLTYVGGNMFKVIPNANALLIKWTLHDWNDEECKRILKNCKEAIPNKENGGKLIVIDMVVEVDKGENELFMETQLMFDVLAMCCLTGRQRSEQEWAKLFFDVGFSDYKITPILGLRSLIEVYP